jgi:hypothetical protein
MFSVKKIDDSTVVILKISLGIIRNIMVENPSFMQRIAFIGMSIFLISNLMVFLWGWNMLKILHGEFS